MSSHTTACTLDYIGKDVPREKAVRYMLARIMLNMTITESGCWEWQGCKDDLGYGNIILQKKKYRLHRFMFEALTNKPAPADKDICHSCHNRACINPYHIRPDTHQANMMDSSRDKRLQGQTKTHCKRGHLLAGDNLSTGVFRHCKICSRGRYRKRLGWPEHLAFSPELVPDGYKLDRVTHQIVPVNSKVAVQQTVIE